MKEGAEQRPLVYVKALFLMITKFELVLACAHVYGQIIWMVGESGF